MHMSKEVKIALAAIVAVVLLFIGINFLKGINVFTSSNTYYVRFKNIGGLAVSNAVYANGYPVGIVRTIDYDYGSTERVTVGVELDKEMRVPRGTRAELESQLMGGVNMNLVLGPNPADNLQPFDTLQGGMHQGAMMQLETMVPTLAKMLPKIDSILTNLNALSADPALAQTLHNTAQLTAQLNQTAKSLNGLMQNDLPQITGHLSHTAAHIDRLSANLAEVDVQALAQSVQATLENAQRFSSDMSRITGQLDHSLGSTDNTLGLMLQSRDLYDNLNGTMRSADSLLIDLRQHPKRYVHFSLFGRKDK